MADCEARDPGYLNVGHACFDVMLAYWFPGSSDRTIDVSRSGAASIVADLLEVC